MATRLTTTAIYTRKAIRYGIIGLILFMIARVIFLRVYEEIQTRIVPKEPEPTLGFGVLPPVGFPEQKNELPVLEYVVETTTGTLPNFPGQMKVYPFVQKRSNFYSYDNMIEKARSFGFTREPEQDIFNPRRYVFQHVSVPAQMQFDIITETFSISFNLASDSSPLQSRTLTPNSAIARAQSRLQSADSFPDELKEGPTSHIFLKVDGQNLVTALALAEAQLVQVSFFRKNFEQTADNEGYRAVTANPQRSNVWFIVSGSGDGSKQLVAGEYKFFPTDRSLFHTYPIKTAEQALRDLVDGEGYVASLGFNLDGNIAITNVYLAYFDPAEPGQFIQPVIVFEGRDNFVAYVPAITDEFIGEKNQDQ